MSDASAAAVSGRSAQEGVQRVEASIRLSLSRARLARWLVMVLEPGASPICQPRRAMTACGLEARMRRSHSILYFP